MAASLLRELARMSDRYRMIGCGGPSMREVFHEKSGAASETNFTSIENAFSWKQEQIAVNGIGDVVFKIPFFIRYLHDWKQLLIRAKPDLLVLVDYSGFNSRLMKFAKRIGVPILVIAPPQIWARQRHRYRFYLGVTIICTLPFEQVLWDKLGADAHYYGHPSIGKLSIGKLSIVKEERVDLLICPGSRRKQVKRSLQVADKLMGELISQPVSIERIGILWVSEEMRDKCGSLFTYPHRSYIMSSQGEVPRANWVWSTLGTMSLEIALLGLPLTVIHPLDFLTFHWGRSQIKLKSFSLPNILWGQNFISEVIFWHKEWKKVLPQMRSAWEQASSAPYERLSSELSPELSPGNRGESFARNCTLKIREILAK